MPLFTHSGTSASDLGAAGTIRQDISDDLLASLATENNFLGSLTIGPEFGDPTALRWVEDALNPTTVKDNTSGGLNNSQTNWTVATTADAAILEIGALVIDDTLGNYQSGEIMQVTAVSGTAITVTRGYGGTTATTHANGAVFKVISRPLYENSDLGRDLSRPRIPKSNLFQRFSRDVNLSQEVITRARYGYSPGVPDEMKYQYEQRKRELLTEFDLAVLYARQAASGTASTGGDYSTTGGVIAWLDGTLNSTSVAYNAAGAVISDTIINGQNKYIIRNGAVPEWLFGGTNFVDSTARIYNDRIRIVQDDTTRGFEVQTFRTTMQNTLRLLWDNNIADANTLGLALLLDPERIRWRPFLESLGYSIQAPSFRDGDAVRFIMKGGLEMRNTGSDSGQAHQLIYNLSW